MIGLTRGRPSVLMTADVIGGVFTYAIELARGLAHDGTRVVLATMGGEMSPHQRQLAQAVPGLELHESVWRLEWMVNPWDDVAAAGRWLLELERRYAPDVVHLNGFVHAALPFSAPRLAVGHSCVLSWIQAVHGVEAPKEWARYRSLVNEGLQRADAVVAPTRAMGAELERLYDVKSVVVIPNARDPKQFAPGVKEPFAMCAGRLWDQAKNVAALDAIADALPWPVRVAGDTHAPAGGAAQLTRMESLGRLDEGALADWLARCSIYVHPARYEPFGLTVLEAAMSGCALVLGDIPSLRENWEGAALFVPPGDTAGLSRTLTELMRNEPRRLALSQKALARSRRFSPEPMTAAYGQLYASLRRNAAEARA